MLTDTIFSLIHKLKVNIDMNFAIKFDGYVSIKTSINF